MADMIEQNISHRTKVQGTYILTCTLNSACEKFKKHWENYITCTKEYELMAKNWRSEI